MSYLSTLLLLERQTVSNNSNEVLIDKIMEMVISDHDLKNFDFHASGNKVTLVSPTEKIEILISKKSR